MQSALIQAWLRARRFDTAEGSKGVFFRATTQSISRGHDVTGWVRNDPDGSVLLVAEGNEGEVEAFLDNIDEALSEYIQDRRIVKDPSEREFDAFDIRFA
ncbi:MAG: acylphosphatase [Phycisphaerales bacterium]|nr:acylphosphatase [Phycisphaerales bacterium]